MQLFDCSFGKAGLFRCKSLCLYFGDALLSAGQAKSGRLD